MLRRPTLLALAAALVACRREAPKVEPVPTESVDVLAPSTSVTDVSLPTSTATAHPAEGLRVYVGRRELAIGEPPRKLAMVPSDASRGFGADLKANGANDLMIVPLKVAVHAADHALLYVDRSTPYRALIEVMYTLGQSKISRFELVTTSAVGRIAAVSVVAPARTAPCALLALPVASGSAAPSAPCVPKPSLAATVLVSEEGFAVKAVAANVAPGCEGVGPGLAVAKHDVAALRACLAKLKEASHDFDAEDTITIAAEGAIPAQRVIDVADAARPVLPRVVFAIAR